MVDEEADPIKDLEEPERLLVEDTQFTKIQVHSVITKPEPFIHTQPMSPLYGIFKSYKSSTTMYKVDREMKSPSRLHSSTWATKRFKRLVAYAKCNRDSYERTHFKSGLVGYHAKDDDGIFVIMDVARKSKLEAWLR
nr:hypothetical protein [Tanacetum cinerariifolium]